MLRLVPGPFSLPVPELEQVLPLRVQGLLLASVLLLLSALPAF